MGAISTHIRSVSEVFSQLFSRQGYVLLALGATTVFVALPILIPVWFVPSNSIPLVLSLMRPVNYLLLILLAAASGTLISLNIFLLRRRRLGVGTASETGVSALASLFGGIVSSSCGCGIGFVFGFLGLGVGGTTFLIVNQVPIMLAALALVLGSLYLAARKAKAGAGMACAVAPVSISNA